jgi:hypothetical protein
MLECGINHLTESKVKIEVGGITNYIRKQNSAKKIVGEFPNFVNSLIVKI